MDWYDFGRCYRREHETRKFEGGVQKTSLYVHLTCTALHFEHDYMN